MELRCSNVIDGWAPEKSVKSAKARGVGNDVWMRKRVKDSKCPFQLALTLTLVSLLVSLLVSFLVSLS
jgi:hypothetical protein